MTLSMNASGGAGSRWFFVRTLTHCLSEQLWTVLFPSSETKPSSPVSSAENGGEIARVWYSSVKVLWHVGMCLGLRQIRKKHSPHDSMIKKAPRQNQLVPKKSPNQNPMKVKRGCFGAFLLWRKEKHFLQLLMTHHTYLKTTGIFGGRFEGSLWVEMKFIQRVKLSFRKGSNQHSSGVKDTSQGWIHRELKTPLKGELWE